MCKEHISPTKNSWYNPNQLLILALILGLSAGAYPVPVITGAANVISEIFINLLRLVSLPIIFLSIVATASGMESLAEIKQLGSRTVKYTILTTLLAATVGLAFYVTVNPAAANVQTVETIVNTAGQSKSYWTHLMQAIPSNFVKPFVENNVISVLFLAIIFSLAILGLPLENRQMLHKIFHSLFMAVMKITTWIIKVMPIAIWAFIVLFINDLRNGLDVSSLALYLFCVVMANIVQAFVVLPLLLKYKGLNPITIAKGMLPALSVAFFTKSSAAALPTAIQCATERVGVSSKTSNFSLPLCTTINMNGCAAFILITVLFVSMSNGVAFSPVEMVSWIFVATIAAVGNASVPMGCYFLASAFLAAMDIPLNIMGIILPFYSFIDMLETAINVWSDSCVTVIVDKEISALPVGEHSHAEAMA